jgi:enoyl-CoA hydratase
MTEILTTRQGTLGRITLNRPRALNALTLGMVRDIDSILQAWLSDDAVKLVLIEGAGARGLCAGGDIRALYDAGVPHDLSLPEIYFRAEYRMNARIAAYPKPYVAFMDGIVMGGGVGVSAHGRFRVVTERTRLAMPETGIGFMPDVGGSFLLGRAPHHYGIHAALTASEMGASDAIACGLADLCVPSAALADIAAALATCRTAREIEACLAGYAAHPEPGLLDQNRAWIEACYAAPRVEDILHALDSSAVALARDAAASIRRKSPLSLKVTLRALREARALGALDACLAREYRLALAFMARHDFREGVRAAVVDKDRNPAWLPASLEGVTGEMVERMFLANQEAVLF